MASPNLPTVVQVMNDYKDELLRQEQSAMRRMASAWREVERALQSDVENLAMILDDLVQAGETISETGILQMERTQSLLAQARVEVAKYGEDTAEPLILSRQSQLVGDGLEHAQDLIDVSSTVRTAFDRLPVDELEYLVGLSGDGSSLLATLQNSYAYGAQGILTELHTGMGRGIGPRAMARNAIRNGLSQSLNHMLTVMRTESLRVYRQASLTQYQASGLVTSYKRIATFDIRTCPGCLAAHGRIYRTQDGFLAHPQCRCALIPQVVTGPILDVGNAEAWFRSQNRDAQLDIMGPGRMEYLDRGGDFNRLSTVRNSPVWGGAIVPTPVGELLF